MVQTVMRHLTLNLTNPLKMELQKVRTEEMVYYGKKNKTKQKKIKIKNKK